MPEIMKTNRSKAVCLEQLRKAFGDIVRLDKIANLIDAHIVKIFLVVAASAETAVLLLFLSQSQKLFLDKRNEGKRSHARLCFCGVRCYEDSLAVQIAGCNCVTDGNGVMLKVNGIPFQTDCLTAAKSVECTEQDRQLKLASFGGFKESVHLIGIIEAANKAILFRTLNLVCRVHFNQVNLHCVLERLMNVGMIVNDRGSTDTLKLFQVKLLNVLRGQIFERYFFLTKVRCDDPLNRC